MSRAAALFEAAIPAGHRGFVDAYLWAAGDAAHSPDAEEQLLRLLPEASRASVATGALDDFSGDGGEDAVPVVRLTCASSCGDSSTGRSFGSSRPTTSD